MIKICPKCRTAQNTSSNLCPVCGKTLLNALCTDTYWNKCSEDKKTDMINSLITSSKVAAAARAAESQPKAPASTAPAPHIVPSAVGVAAAHGEPIPSAASNNTNAANTTIATSPELKSIQHHAGSADDALQQIAHDVHFMYTILVIYVGLTLFGFLLFFLVFLGNLR